MKHEVKEIGDHIVRIRITLDNDDEFEIRVEKEVNFIEVLSIFGSINITPSVSNVIRVSATN